jgi:DNA-binding winged helix-turn-helix (wHTH) protein
LIEQELHKISARVIVAVEYSRHLNLDVSAVRIRLRQQTFQILLMLVERPGAVVLRQDIRERLWPNDTVVEFEHSINSAVQKLRDALGDTAGRLFTASTTSCTRRHLSKAARP